MMSKDTRNDRLVCDIPSGSRFLVVGLGGIGGALLTPLALFLHSLQTAIRLVLIDGDQFEPANASRQIFRALGNKAEIKAAEVRELLDASDVTVTAIPKYLSGDTIAQMVRPGDHVFLCVDNHESRRLVSDHCQTLSSVTLLSGGNEGYDPPREMGTYGNVQIVIRRNGKNMTVPLTHYHPEIARAIGQPPHELPGCGQISLSQPQLIFTNFAVASAMLNVFFAHACGLLQHQEVQLDILASRMLPQFPLRGCVKLS